MGREDWLQERAELQEVLDQIASGKLSLENGQDEYIANLSRLIAHLDEQLAAGQDLRASETGGERRLNSLNAWSQRPGL